MADKGFSKGWLIAVLALLIAQAAAIKIMTAERASLSDLEAGSTPIYDEQGRYIIVVGDVELRVPDDVLDWMSPPNNPYEILSLTFCWPDTQTYNYCADSQSRIRVHLQGQPSSQDFPFADGNSVLARNTESYGEPIETTNPLVKKYEIKPGSGAASYVIMRMRESGHYPIARCDGLTCGVAFTASPGLRVTYDFWQTHIDDWQGIDQFVTSRIGQFTLKE